MSGEAKDKASALRRAQELGCSGAHKHPDGSWMACETHEEYERLEAEEEREEKSVLSRMHDFQSVRERKGRRKKKKNKKTWEKLGERGVASIDTIPGGGLVSGSVGKAASAIPHEGDEDVFTDIRSARRRARQLGCIGVARRRSRNGTTVWTPCSNITDYARRTGTTALGRRYQARLARQEARRLVEEEFLRTRKRYKRKVSLHEELNGKSLGRRAQRFDPNAVDGDNDGMVQDGSAFQRPVTPKAPSAFDLKKHTKLWNSVLQDDPGYMREAPASVLSGITPENRARFAEIQDGMRHSRIGAGGRTAAKKILDKVEPQHRNKPPGSRKVHFVGGTTGAGKTTLMEDGTLNVPDSNAAAVIDPDEIKKGLEGYDNGRGASLVHEASRQSTDKTMDSARDLGTDIVVTGTGKRTEHLQWARNNGYSTAGHFVYIPDDVADKRLAERNAINREQGGPVLPGHFGSQIAGEMRAIVPRQITSGLYDEFYLWNNNVQPPSLIAKRTPDGEFEINDNDAFTAFFGARGAQHVLGYWQSQSRTPEN